MPSNQALASNFGGFDEAISIFFISAFLALESLVALVLFFFKKFKSLVLRNSFNGLTIILFLLGLAALLSFVASRGTGLGEDEVSLLLLLVLCGFIAGFLPNYQYNKNAT